MTNIAVQRLHNQQLEQPKFSTPAEVVGWLGAVQAQEYALAKWALGSRLEDVSEADVEQALTDGLILRTHVMRPTWHFVTPADIRWLLELTAPRVNAFNAYMYRQLELDDDLFQRSNAAITAALQGGRHLTRAEIGGVLNNIGIQADAMRLGYIVHRAELDALVCSGVRRGKAHTYALLAERAPQAQSLPREVALAELVRRFFTSHGSAEVKDFAWWSGLTQADTKLGLEMAKPHIVSEIIDGKTYWRAASVPTSPAIKHTALLLPPYDEFTIAYRDHQIILDPQYQDLATDTIFSGVTVINGHIVGNWRRTFKQKSVVIESAPFRPFSPAENDAFAAAAKRFSDFLGMPVILVA